MQNEVSVLAAFFHMVIFMNNEKRIISFPAGKTYEHILHTSVHAHPIKRGFPKEPTSYVMFRKSGGEMEYLFRVKKTVDFYIQDLLSGTVSLSGIDNAELEQIKTYVFIGKGRNSLPSACQDSKYSGILLLQAGRRHLPHTKVNHVSRIFRVKVI